jgi:cell division septum initiation protein DivIVA
VITVDLLTLVDRLEALVNDGWRVPFTVRTVINEDAFFEIVDQMRVSIPQELRHAEEVMEQRDSVLAAARAEGEKIVEEAQSHSERLLDEHDMVVAARAEAEKIWAQAHLDADEVRRGADDYAMGLLSELESRLSSLLRTTSNGLSALKRRQSALVEEPEDKASQS